MPAKKLARKHFEYVRYLEERIGPISDPTEMWLPQVERNADLGLVEPEFLLHIFTNIELFYKSRPHRSYMIVKRIIDIIVATIMLPFMCLLYAAIAVAIKIDSKGPVFFKQTRIGFLGLPFTILKFRTMYDESAYMIEGVRGSSIGAYFKCNHDPRITRVGRFLRRWSLDETPQFINILLGDMTLVGPRPLPVYDVVAVPYARLDRFCVKPGLTGLWQVTARDSNDGAKNLLLDSHYANTIGWKLDLKIILKTPWIVLTGIGAR